MQVTTIGLDIAKNVFQVHGVDQHGKVALRKRLSRGKVLAFFANLPRCVSASRLAAERTTGPESSPSSGMRCA